MSQPINLDATAVVDAYRTELSGANERLIVSQATVSMLQKRVTELEQQLAELAQQAAEPVPKGSKK